MAAGFAGAVKVRLTDRCNRDGTLCQRQTQMSSSKRTGTLALSRFKEPTRLQCKPQTISGPTVSKLGCDQALFYYARGESQSHIDAGSG